MRKITEEDVLIAYRSLVLKECKDRYKGMEPEDRIAEGMLALLYAIRTYRMDYGCFEKYANLQIRQIMKQRNKEAWLIRRSESILSLDKMLVTGSSTLTMSNYIASLLDDDTIFDVEIFLDSLSLIESRVLQLSLNNSNSFIISKEIGISLSQTSAVITQLKNKASDFFGTANV